MWHWWNSILSGDLHLHINSSIPFLVEEALKQRQGHLSRDGVLVVSSGKITETAAEDKYIVKNEQSENIIDWSRKFRSLSDEKFQDLKTELLARIHMIKPQVYVLETSAGADDQYSLGINLITTSPVHALFCKHIMRERKEKNPLGEFTLYHDPHFEFDQYKYGLRSQIAIALNFSTYEAIIAGTAFCGEIKSCIFSVMNTLLPDYGVLPIHAGSIANEAGDVSVFFGLSGTEVTTLLSDLGTRMIGDDKHGLSDRGIFNLEGGCYAKISNLKKKIDLNLFKAANHFGSILENVVLNPKTREADFDNTSVMEIGRSIYSLSSLNLIVPEGCGKVPSHFFILYADALGVLPPLSRLEKNQAMYYFLLGHATKDFSGTFPDCFGAPFMMRKINDYSLLFKCFLDKHDIKVWLVNAGWFGGPYGIGERYESDFIRSLILAVQNGNAKNVDYIKDDIFNLSIPKHIEGVNDKYLNPLTIWTKQKDYLEAAFKLKSRFDQNYQNLLGRQ